MNGTISNKLVLAGIALLIAVGACAPAEQLDEQAEAAMATITADDLVKHVLVLGSDEFQGRFPGTPGEEKTLEYLRAEAERIGLEPGAGDGWFQEVELVSITADPRMTVSFSGPDGRNEYAYGTEIMAWTTRVVEEVDVDDSELVFVGYGTVAPEYGWNDYEGIDVSGKTVVMLVNDPGFATQDPALFNGRSMTYYGRWTYKYEEAARQGAAAALIIHDTEPAAYGWATVEGSWSGPQLNMVAEDNNMGRVKVEGWLQLEVANEVFAMAGLDLDELSQQAKQSDFTPVPMGVTASTAIRLGPSRHEHRPRRRPDLQRRSRQCQWNGGHPRVGRGVRVTRDAAGALNRLLVDDGRGAGAAGLRLLRGQPDLPVGEDRRRHQHRRPQYLRPDERHLRDRVWQLGARRVPDRIRGSAEP
jgi:hypothetical protein